MLFLVSMVKMGLTHDIFFEFSLRPFEVVDFEHFHLRSHKLKSSWNKTPNKTKSTYKEFHRKNFVKL